MTDLAQTSKHATVDALWSGVQARSDRRRPALQPVFVLPRVSVVIPTLNEAKNLPWLMPRIPPWVHEVIVVDGSSTDNTVAIARRLRSDVRILTQRRRGKGAALQIGFMSATGDIVVILDADGSMDPSEIIMFVGALMSGVDLVKGSRFLQGGGTDDMSTFRQIGNWGLTQIVRVLYGSSFSDLCYGYMAFWSKQISVLQCDCDGFEIETLISVRALRRGLKIAEVASFEARRISGESNLRAVPDGWRILKTILRERLARQVQVPSHGFP
jgi:glycosyltransferase involved in cell wall biosynthesis